MADHQHRSFRFEAVAQGGDHITVNVRAGKQDHSRALLGHLTMEAWEWTVLQKILQRGAEDAAAWGAPSVEIVHHNDGPLGEDA